MFVTADLNLTLEQIEALNEEELMKIYYQRIEDWIINPMKILNAQPHTGWAMLQVFIMGAELLPFQGMHGDFSHILSHSKLFVTGELEEPDTYFKIDDNKNMFVKPSSLIIALESAISICKSKNWKPNLEKFKEILTIKAKVSE